MVASLGTAGAGYPDDESAKPKRKKIDVDKVQGAIGAGVRGLAARLDRFFTDERSLAEEQESRLLVTPTVKFVQGSQPEYSMPINAKIQLPRLEEKLQLQLTTTRDDDPDLDDEGDGPLNEALGDESERRAFLGLVYTGVAERTRNVSLRGGFLLRDGEVKLATSLRGRFTQPAGRWVQRLTQTFFHDGDEFGSRSVLDFDRPINPTTLFRSASEALVTESTPGFELLQQFLLRHLIDHYSGVEFFFTTEGVTDPATVADRYRLGVEYRMRVWRDWLTLSLQPELRFPRDQGFDREAALFISLETRF